MDVPDHLSLEHLRGTGLQPREKAQPEVCFLGCVMGVHKSALRCAAAHARPWAFSSPRGSSACPASSRWPSCGVSRYTFAWASSGWIMQEAARSGTASAATQTEARPASIEPDAAVVSSLVGMGFTENGSKRAAVATQVRILAAAQRPLPGQHSASYSRAGYSRGFRRFRVTQQQQRYDTGQC